KPITKQLAHLKQSQAAVDDYRSDDEMNLIQDSMPTNVLLTPITSDNISLTDSFAPAYDEETEKLSCYSQSFNTTTEEQIANIGSMLENQQTFQEEYDQKMKIELEAINR